MEPIRLTGSVELQAAAGDKPARVSILAYSGGVMTVGGYGDVVIDLTGLAMPPTIPLLGDHAATLDGVAGAGTASVEGGKLFVSGTLSGTPTGQRVRDLAASGVPLQASVGVAPTDTAPVRAGEKVSVNGRNVTAGPRGLTVIRAGLLREVSILPLGADSSTTVQVTAKRPGMTETETETTTTADTAAPDPIQVERNRVREIRALCAPSQGAPGFPAIEAEAVDDGWTVERVKAACLDALRASRAPVTFVAGGCRTLAGANPRDVLAASVMLMAGNGAAVVKAFPNGEQLANALSRPSGWPELAAAALRAEHRDVPHDRNEMLRAAFSTTSLPVAVGSAVEKTALQVFLDQSSNWRAVSRIVSATSFREGKAVRLATGNRFEKVARGGSLKYGTIGEESFSYKIDTYGEIYGITRQDIIDDNAGILNDISMVIGNDSAKAIADTFFDVLIGNTGSYFGAGHGNLGHDALGFDGLTAAVAAIRTATDGDGRIVGLQPQTLVVPAALEFTARQLLNSQQLFRDQQADMQPSGNPLQGLNLTLAVEPRLDADSTTDWYLFAQPYTGQILVALLNGRLGPVVETMQQEADYLGMKVRGYMDFGVSLAEYRGAYKSDVSPYA